MSQVEHREAVCYSAFVKARGLVALLLAGCTALAIHLYLRSVALERSGGPPVEVVVATDSLPQGGRIVAQSIAVKEIPASFVHPEAIRREEFREYVGRPVQNAIAASQPLLKTDFASRSVASDQPLSQVLPKGMRAITIPADLSSSLGGFLRPGDHVDVLGTFVKGQGGERSTVTLLQNVLVLATGTRLDSSTPTSPQANFLHITLAATLEEAELLAFSMTRGQVHVILRHAEDLQIIENIPEKDFADIFEPQRRAVLQSKRRTIEHLRPQGGR